MLFTPSSGMALLLSAINVTSAVTSVDFTGLDSAFDEYELHYINAVPATSSATAWLRMSHDNGAAFPAAVGDYEFSLVRCTASGLGPTLFDSAATGTGEVVLSGLGVEETTAPGGISGVLRLFNPAGTAHYKRLSFQSAHANASGLDQMAMAWGHGVRVSTSAVNAIRFLFSTGNITSGKFKLYGVRPS